MMTRMLNLRDSIARKIEMLPISNVKRDMAQANFAAAEESVDRVARLVKWLGSGVASTPPGERTPPWTPSRMG